MCGIGEVSMKINETIERECCVYQKDLKKYNGLLDNRVNDPESILFCVHCGQLWKWVRKLDCSGNNSEELQPLFVYWSL